MTKTPSRRSQLLTQLRSINPDFTSGKAIGNLISVPCAASLNSIAYMEAAIVHLGFTPIGPTPKAPKGWPKGKPRGKISQKVVLDYCATLPKGEYSVKDITEGSGKSRGTVISALGLGANKQIVWYGKNNESVN